ncbi:hypothetical protein BJF90_13520 [Pseudonocardia sp. CNS-004]|nr:hypothetical protein BJF90_13520 [Pseudonocardia sp. CNS-004]
MVNSERAGATSLRRGRNRWLAALVAGLGLLLASCAGGPADGGDSGDGPIVIGGTLGLTGAYSGPSAGYKAAYDMWLQDVNASGGLLGRQVEMKIYDDESNPTTAQQLYQRLINEDGVDLLLAPYTTAVGGAVVPLTERAGKVLFNGGFISRKLHSTSRMMVTSWPSQEEDVPRPFFDYLASLPVAERPTTIAVATLQNPFTLGERDGFEGKGGVLRMAEAAGMKVVLSEEYDAGATDLTGLIERVQQSGARRSSGSRWPATGRCWPRRSTRSATSRVSTARAGRR